ncbi:MAG TPA: exosortase/archaeosortase family protein [Planctomycetaceae bacterium]|nr:exosortase/archaeosortase family protein [Planctomycetaceae bacterium]
MTPSPKPNEWNCPDWRSRLVATIVFGVAIVILFRDLLAGCLNRWSTEPQYSHGFAIPIMAFGLGWMSRNKFLKGTARSNIWGLGMLFVGIVGHVAAVYVYAEAVDALSFLLLIAGSTLLIWGRRAFYGLWPAVLFIGFMLPLPFQIERALSGPLQQMGATESAWYIQTFGIPAIAQGNTILMGDTRLGVADACSGLRMLMVFLAISTAAVIISKRTAWEKLLMLLSAIPIALVCNIIRIVATAVAHQSLGRQTADLVFHDLSGWLMMPLAMLLLFLELKLLDCLFVEVRDSSPGVSYHQTGPVFSGRQA